MIVILTLYRSRGWRWRMTARNGKVIGSSTEGYRRRCDAARNLLIVTGIIAPEVGWRWHMTRAVPTRA